ncbi:MAG: hypothetical protein MJ059_04050 [Lachnospiraceae bacterium]|nr:hypothetical protein [Lachnospiraceae bacterium]
MGIVVLKIWLIVLVVIDVMLFFQAFSRVVLYIAGRTGEIDWTVYNIIMLKLLAVAFLPITAMVLYLKK